jgi:hypothetical protein
MDRGRRRPRFGEAVRTRSAGGERLEHDVQTDVAILAVVERAGDRREDLEPELLPEMDSCVFGLDHRVELHAAVPRRARPCDDMPPERAAGAVAVMLWIDHEARGRDMRAATRTVWPHGCAPENPLVADGDNCPPGGSAIHRGRACAEDRFSG